MTNSNIYTQLGQRNIVKNEQFRLRDGVETLLYKKVLSSEKYEDSLRKKGGVYTRFWYFLTKKWSQIFEKAISELDTQKFPKLIYGFGKG